MYDRQVATAVGSISGSMIGIVSSLNHVYKGRRQNFFATEFRNDEERVRFFQRALLQQIQKWSCCLKSTEENHWQSNDARFICDVCKTFQALFVRRLILSLSAVTVGFLGGHSFFEMLFLPNLKEFGGNLGHNQFEAAANKNRRADKSKHSAMDDKFVTILRKAMNTDQVCFQQKFWSSNRHDHLYLFSECIEIRNSKKKIDEEP